MRPDDFLKEVKRTLALRVGNVCSRPECNALTSGPQDDPGRVLNVGVAAHITAAAPGGPRYNPSLSAEERRHPENGIWLCQICAKLVDNDPSQFPVDLLRAWKTNAEHKAKNSIGKTLQVVPESESQRKVRAILSWKGKDVTLTHMRTGKARSLMGSEGGSSQVKILDCTELWVTVGIGYKPKSFALTNIDIAFDDAQNRLKLQVQ